MPTQVDLTGRILDDRYRVDRRLAAGGMATVYQGYDQRLDRTVAIKVMHDSFAAEPGFISRFETEARAAARLSDPHVVAVFDRGRTPDAVYLVLEYVPGRTLREELTWGGRLSVSRALSVLSAVLKALMAAHRAGFVHGDIKPENVLLGDQGEIKVTDFGLARAIEAGAEREAQLLGTAAYLAPEQVTDRIPDPRSDLYSAGILLFEMLTGHVPFRADTSDDVLELHRSSSVPAPSVFVDVPTAVDDLCLRATNRDPSERFNTAEQMAATALGVQTGIGWADEPPRKVRDVDPEEFHTVVVSPVLPETMAADQPEAFTGPESPTDSPPRAQVEVVAPPPPPMGSDIHPVKRKRRRRGVVLAFIAAIALLVGYIGWELGTQDTVATPKLAGMTRSEALSALRDVGLTMRVSDEQFSEKRGAGTIIRSDPPGGDQAVVGSTISVVMSKGPERFDVPAVRGRTPDDARNLIEAANLTVGTVSEDWSRGVDAGLVISSNPPVGTALKRDTPVALTVSLGPEPVVVPEVSGMSADQASNTLIAAGFKVRTRARFDDVVPLGNVISTTPTTGTTAYRGDRITMFVSKGSNLVPVPSVLGFSTQDAEAALEAAGFDVIVEEQFGVTLANRVLSQDPGGGSSAPLGSTVTLTIT